MAFKTHSLAIVCEYNEKKKVKKKKKLSYTGRSTSLPGTIPRQPKTMCGLQVDPVEVDDECWNEILQATDANFCKARPRDNQLEDVTAEIGQYFPSDEMHVGLSPTLSSFDCDWSLYDGNELERQVTKTTDMIIHGY